MEIGDKTPAFTTGTPASSATESSGKTPEAAKSRGRELHRVSRDLEGLFLTQLFKALEKTVPKSGLLGSRNSLPSMLYSSVMGKAVAERGGIGLHQVIYRALQAKDDKSELPSVQPDLFLEQIETFKLSIFGESD
jgi:Rod binding domain-containing protein